MKRAFGLVLVLLMLTSFQNLKEGWAWPFGPQGGGSITSYSGVVSLFGSGSCSGYLKSDGTCDSTPSLGLTGTGLAYCTYSGGCTYSSLTLDTDLSSVSVSDDSVPSAKATTAALDLKADKGAFALTASTELTLASDAITVTQALHTIDTEGDAATDDLVTVNGGAAGKIIYLTAAHADRTVVLKETGNIVIPHGPTITLSSTGRWVELIYDDGLSKWVVVGDLADTLSFSSMNLADTILDSQCTAAGEPASCCTGSGTGTCGTFVPVGTETPPVAEGQIYHNSSTDVTTIGNGASAVPLAKYGTLTNTKWCTSDGTAINCTEDAPAGSGDVTDVGDCAGGACYDGSSDGGTYVRLYDGTSAYESITGGVRLFTFASSTADSENMTWTLGANDNTILLSSSTGANILNLTGFTVNATSFSAAASASPTVLLKDSDAPGTDKEIGKIVGAYIDGADGSENGTVSIYAHEAGTTTEYIQADGKNVTIDLLKPVVATGAVTMNGGFSATGSNTVDNGATSAGYIYFKEDSSNGTNTAQLIGPASTDDVVITLPAATGTVALVKNEKLAVFNIPGTSDDGTVVDSYIPVASTITGVIVTTTGAACSAVVDIWSQAYADFPPENAQTITASAPPTLTTAQMSKDTTLTGWTTAVAADTILRANLDSSDCAGTIQVTLIGTK